MNQQALRGLPRPSSPYTRFVPTKLQILHLIDKNRLTTGSVAQTLEAARGLQRLGHEVWVGSRPGDDLETACATVGLPFLGLPFRGLIDRISLDTVNELFIMTQPAHLQKLKGCELDTPERDQNRAEFVRRRLASLN